MSADLFFLPFRPAIGPSGIVLPGAKLYFYYSQTTLFAPIYAEEELITPLANPLAANGVGTWPNIYLNSGIVYRVVMKTNADVTVFEADPYIPGVAEYDIVDVGLPAFSGFGPIALPSDARNTLQAAVSSLSVGGYLYVDQAASIGTTSLATKGVTLLGKPITFEDANGLGRRLINKWGRERRTHFGEEYLARWYYLLDVRANSVVVIVGDSNSEGYVGAALEQLLSALPGVTVYNCAISGSYEAQWLNETGPYAVGQPGHSKGFSAVMAMEPDLIINGFGGTNDPYYGRDAAMFLASKRQTVEAIRANPLGIRGACSVVLCTANAQRNGADNRDEAFLAEVNPGIAALCDEPEIEMAFFDKNALFASGTPDWNTGGFSYKWIDEPGVHTQYAHTTLLAQALYEFLVPSAYRAGTTAGSMFGNPTDGLETGLEPADFPLGLTQSRVVTPDYPLNGWVLTSSPESSGGSFPLQVNWGFGGDGLSVWVRRAADSTTWGGWFEVSGIRTSLVTPAAGFSLPGTNEDMKTMKQGRAVFAQGYLTMDTPAALTTGTTLATIAATDHPVIYKWWCDIVVWDGSTWEQLRGRVTTFGELTVQEDGTLVPVRIYIDDSWIGAA